ncbi:MAG: PorT family protein [Bacteroidales bacterium]|nr:PorT family protein [Bacteroidales bacterium]
MNSKTLILMTVALLSGTIAIAQPEPGTFSVIPKVGISANKFTGDTDEVLWFGIADMGRYYEIQRRENPTHPYQVNVPEEEYYNQILMTFDKPKIQTGFTGGVDFQYQISRRWAVSVGLNYSYKRCGFKTSSEEQLFARVPNFEWESESLVYKMHYYQFPILAKFYIYKGLALNAGAQFGGLRQAYRKYESRVLFYSTSQYFIRDEVMRDYWWSSKLEVGKWYSRKTDVRLTRNLEKFDFSIPVGLSYEYKELLFDARADIGLTSISKNDDIKCRNLGFVFSIGYRFDL